MNFKFTILPYYVIHTIALFALELLTTILSVIVFFSILSVNVLLFFIFHSQGPRLILLWYCGVWLEIITMHYSVHCGWVVVGGLLEKLELRVVHPCTGQICTIQCLYYAQFAHHASLHWSDLHNIYMCNAPCASMHSSDFHCTLPCNAIQFKSMQCKWVTRPECQRQVRSQEAPRPFN